jgi:hypothetical protein
VWEVLSADALPARRDLAWLELRRLPALTPDAMFRAPQDKLQHAVQLTGPRRDEKIEKLRTLVGIFKRHRDGLATDTLAKSPLLAAARRLRLLAPLEHDVRARALLFVAGFDLLPLDDGAIRVVQRLAGRFEVGPGGRPAGGAIRRKMRRSARRRLRTGLPEGLESYRSAVIYLRHHAQHTCLPVRPHCAICPLESGCLSRETPGTDDHRSQRS